MTQKFFQISLWALRKCKCIIISLPFLKLLTRSCRWQKLLKSFWKFHNIHRKTPVLNFLFNKAVSLKACNFIKKRLQHSSFPVNIVKSLLAAFLTEHLRRLLLFKVLNKNRITKLETYRILKKMSKFEKSDDIRIEQI